MTTYDHATARTTPADRRAGLRTLSGLTAALVLGSVVGTGVIGVELLTHTGTTTATTAGTSAGTGSGTTSGTTNGAFFGDDGGGDDGGRTATGAGQSGQAGQSSQSQSGSGLLGSLLGGGSGSPNATSGGS